jgi:hypothetical protein
LDSPDILSSVSPIVPFILTHLPGGFMNIVDRAKNIIMTPKTEWPAIASEQPVVGQIISGYVIPLALIPAVASILGFGLIGRGMVASFSWGIAMGIIGFVVAVGGVYLTAYVIDFLAPNFGSQKNFGRAMQLVAYSYTPVWWRGYSTSFLLWGFSSSSPVFTASTSCSWAYPT